MDERLGDAYDEALRKIARLEETNGALCAEINRQERVIEEQRRLVANRDESIHNLVKLLDTRQERIKALESLVRDMYRAWLATVDDYYAQSIDGYYERMAELGIEP